ncbi:pH-response regulator protein palH/rim21 [Ascosphaera aggregata]|nr:pH-response regulator protein palH/rim21 [Ascosphaera aggregata]
MPVADGIRSPLSATNLELIAPTANGRDYGAGNIPLSPPLRPCRLHLPFAPSVIMENGPQGANEASSLTTPLSPPVSGYIRQSRSAVNLTIPQEEQSIVRTGIARPNNRQAAVHECEHSRGRPQHRQQREVPPPLTYRGIRQDLFQSYSPGYRRPVSQPADVRRSLRHTRVPPRRSFQVDREMGSTTRFDAYVDRPSMCAERSSCRTHTYQCMEDEYYPQFADQLLDDHLARVSSASARPCSRPRPPHHTFSGLSSANWAQVHNLFPTQHRRQSSDRRFSTSTAVSRNRRQALETLERCCSSIDPDNRALLDQELSGLQSILSQTTETCVPLNPAVAASAEQERKRDDKRWRHDLLDPTGDCGICMTGLFCPCVLVGRTAHRLKLKNAHQDANYVYGMPQCNAQCVAFVILCGCQDFNIFLEHNATFVPRCREDEQFDQPNVPFDHIDPFYSSVLPQMYALGTATVISYLLLIILVITPRTFFVAGRGGGGASFLGRRGMIAGSYGGASVIGVGGRPWLQKVAALTVTVSLSIASAHTFRVAKHQYERHFMDSTILTQKVLDSMEIRVVRVISITFLWLAQVQTLIRLFPRHKEKVAIKWIGFALIVLDTVFTILNIFTRDWRQTVNFAGSIRDAVSALNYLFELSLSCLYAAWVLVYTMSKHRFAFFHPKQKNICLVAFLSMTAVLIPVIFFVLDISKPDISPWGEYIRWVGSAAASVVVWEWVERIEALERDERKDGILGREIFDGEELVDVTQSQEFNRSGRKNRNYSGLDDGDEDNSASDSDDGEGGGVGARENGKRYRRNRIGFSSRFPAARKRFRRAGRGLTPRRRPDRLVPDGGPGPVDRDNTPSVDSTVYRVRCRSLSLRVMRSLREESEREVDLERGGISPQNADEHAMVREDVENGRLDPTGSKTADTPFADQTRRRSTMPTKASTSIMTRGLHLLSAFNFFKRKRTTPPPEVVNAQRGASGNLEMIATNDDRSARVAFGSDVHFSTSPLSHSSSSRLRLPRHSKSTSGRHSLPVTVIPVARGLNSRRPYGNARPSPAVNTLNGHGVRTGSHNSGLPVVVIPARSRRPAPQQLQDNAFLGESTNGLRSESSLPFAPVRDAEEDIVAEASTGEDGQQVVQRQPGHQHQSHHRQIYEETRNFHADPDSPSLYGWKSDNQSISPLALRRTTTPDTWNHLPRSYQHSGVEREVDDGAISERGEGAAVQVIRVSSPMSSLFSDVSTEDQGDRQPHQPQPPDSQLHMPIPQPPPLAYQAATTHRDRERAQQRNSRNGSITPLQSHYDNSSD